MVANDHFFKASWPGPITYKLSDFAGLAFFPLFLQAGWEFCLHLAGKPWGPSRRALWVAMAATAVVFALVKLDTPVTDVYRYGLGLLQWPYRAVSSLTASAELPSVAPVYVDPDRTDLLALPAVLFGLRIVRR